MTNTIDATRNERQRRFRERKILREHENQVLASHSDELARIIRHADRAGVPIARELSSDTTHDTLKKLKEYFLELAPIAPAPRKRSTKTK
jgi:hypothetical protein